MNVRDFMPSAVVTLTSLDYRLDAPRTSFFTLRFAEPRA